MSGKKDIPLKTKKSGTHALRNNLYALKLLFSLCPNIVIHMAVLRFLGYFEWIFYSAFFMRYVIKALETEQAVGSILTFLAITIVVMAAMSFYNNYYEGYIFPVAMAKVYSGLNEKLFNKASNVELSCFEDTEFYNKYTLATDKAADKLVETVKNMWGVVLGVIAAAVAFYFMYDCDHLSVLFVIFPIIGNFVFNRSLSQIDFDRNKDLAPYNRRTAYINRVMYLSEYAKEIRLTNAFKLMQRDYQAAIKGMIDVTKKYTPKAMVMHWFRVMFTFSFIFEGVLIYGAYRTLVNHSMGLDKLAVLTSIMVSCTWILIGFTESLVESFKKGLFIDNLRNFMDYSEKIPEDQDGVAPGNEIKTIEFRDVSFAYKEETVISHLSFEIRGQKTYALVGYNGAGKSTIIKLLLRLYDPSEGEILLNGRNIKEYNLQKYRELFVTAFQDYKIFSMSVMSNVLMDEENSEREEEVIRALKLSGVYDRVQKLPKGIHTVLTHEFDENGAELSGGEFQKIVVARAFVKQCPIKIFDEPSSALDPIAEYKLFDSILKDGCDKTMLIISHRLSSVQNADWVFMLENGSIAEQGSHAMLMKQNGIYADMYRKQAVNYLAGHAAEDSIFKTEVGEVAEV